MGDSAQLGGMVMMADGWEAGALPGPDESVSTLSGGCDMTEREDGICRVGRLDVAVRDR